MNVHPPAERLRQWFDGLLSEADSLEVESHLESCVDVCQRFVKQFSGDEESNPPKTQADGVSLDASLPAVPGFDVVGQLGRGGMGIVYWAHERALNRTIAVKVLRPEYAAFGDATRRFQEEAQIASQLQHPGIPPVHSTGRLRDGRPYFAMKLVDGYDLATLLRQRPSPALDLSRYLAIFQQICQTVAYAHSKGVLHRTSNR